MIEHSVLTAADLPSDQLLFIPLGGCEEFGLNLNLYAYGDDVIAVDCGIGFADERHPGIDLLLPDPSFLEQLGPRLKGILITHAHEDHVGAVPYLWPRLKCPIYCPPFVGSFLRRKCSEFEDVKGMVINDIVPDQIIKIGVFTIGVIGVTHSTPATVSLTIETPVGLVVHGNEWNLDPTPKAAVVTNREGFRGAGRRGVLAYVGDSTNAPFSGTSIGEAKVEETIEATMDRAVGRVCITMFASNIGRILSIARAARRLGRQVCLAGRSLHNYVAVAGEHDLIKDIPPFISPREAAGLPPGRVVYIVTGSQGESRAVMARIANQDYRDITLGKGDMVIFSARPIPGNEKEIAGIKSQLYAAGMTVVDVHTTPTIHATGHPYREEISQMIDWVRPHILVPIQGQRVHLEAQAELARAKQVPFTIVPENGQVIVFSENGPSVLGVVESGVLAVEPTRVMALDHIAIRERRQLTEAGALYVSLVARRDGRMVGQPQVSGMGLFDDNDLDDQRVIKDVAGQVVARWRELTNGDAPLDHGYIQDEIKFAARRAVTGALGLRPKTTVHISWLDET